MPEENYQKIKLLKIMEILRQETDEEHPMNKVELAARLVAMHVSCSPRALIVQVNALEEASPVLGKFHLILCNPPYIPTGEIPTLDPEVQREPRMALDGGEDGLDFYRAISEKWKDALAPGGRLYFEVGIGQADDVLRIMRTQGFGDIQIVKDLHDIPRVVYGTLCTEI